ncbi:DUF1643 domain-containing protein [Aureivirga sp. CE67]|uniref:DUF1643 domain-containing protein n=1 Tax=Aureivirga sp. CE67 TaxID=1788983 RepID=UPI0018CB56AF|nr:DUF1643 domain-containing protein [Aureivirga sp. CE67]
MEKGAVISDCEKFRYQLWRKWDETKPLVMFLMLNPSTADANADDPTIRRCINYAKDWGFGGLYVGNLYAFRTAYPKELKEAGFQRGEFNTENLLEMKNKCQKVVCAWGNGEGVPEYITEIFEELHYIDLAKDGTPKHPLYLKKDLEMSLL